jgi:hypothetical protein
MQTSPISSGELAELLGCDQKTVINWAAQGLLRASKTLGGPKRGGHLRFVPREVVEDYRSRGVVPPPKLLRAAGIAR